MKLDHIHIFCQVISAGTLGEAAKQLSLGKSTISRKIDELEADLGSKLLVRSNQGIKLTTSGQRLYQMSNNPLSKLNNIYLSLKKQNLSTAGGHVTIGHPPGAIAAVIDNILLKFTKLYPDIKFSRHMYPTEGSPPAHQFDITFQNHIKGNEASIARKLPGLEFRCFATPDYQKTIDEVHRNYHQHRYFIASTDLARSTDPHDPDTYDFWLKDNTWVSADDARLIKKICLNDDGVGIFCRGQITDEISHQKLVHVFPDISFVQDELWLVYPGNPYLNAQTEALVNLIRDQWEYYR